MSATHGGKGSAQRPTNHRRYSDNYDRIFEQSEPQQPRPKLSDNAPDFVKSGVDYLDKHIQQLELK